MILPKYRFKFRGKACIYIKIHCARSFGCADYSDAEYAVASGPYLSPDKSFPVDMNRIVPADRVISGHISVVGYRIQCVHGGTKLNYLQRVAEKYPQDNLADQKNGNKTQQEIISFFHVKVR